MRDRDRRPGFAAEARADRGGAVGRGLVELDRRDGGDRAGDQLVVGIHEHADAGDMIGHAGGEAGRFLGQDIARGAIEEDEADMAGPALKGGVERGGGGQAADLGSGAGMCAPYRCGHGTGVNPVPSVGA